MYCGVDSAIYEGINGNHITVETEITSGLPYMDVVGHPGTTVLESKNRVKAAVASAGYAFPRGRVTVNLAPAGMRKNGGHLDLPIAVGILVSQLYIDVKKVEETAFFGELSLDGRISGIDGLLPMLLCLSGKGIRRAFVPAANMREAKLADNIEIIPVRTLPECIEIIKGEYRDINQGNEKPIDADRVHKDLDFADVKGQENAKRAICIAASGNHGLFMKGGPGCGKTMLAKRIPGIMPLMNGRESIECAVIRSVAGLSGTVDRGERPFRMPHHTVGKAGLLGGGMYPVPGEITLAHNGVIFLDEFTEFDRALTEGLRIPMEDKAITHTRHGQTYTFPCNCLIVLAANPCACGYYGDPSHECTCSDTELIKYDSRLSGPLFDRIDLHIRMDRVEYEDLTDDDEECMSTETMKAYVSGAIRFAEDHGRTVRNGDMSDSDAKCLISSDTKENAFMENAYSRFELTPRAYIKIIKVARTIADLDGSEKIKVEHLAEALSYRDLGKRPSVDDLLRRKYV